MQTLDLKNKIARAEALAAWVDAFFTSPVEAMSDDLANLFVTLLVDESVDAHKAASDEIASLFAFKVIKSRSAHLGLPITDRAIAFLAYLTQTPGAAVMYLTALRHSHITNADAPIVTVLYIGEKFPNGFLTQEALSVAWEAQKVQYESHSLNLLDNVDPATDFIMPMEEVLNYNPEN